MYAFSLDGLPVGFSPARLVQRWVGGCIGSSEPIALKLVICDQSIVVLRFFIVICGD